MVQSTEPVSSSWDYFQWDQGNARQKINAIKATVAAQRASVIPEMASRLIVQSVWHNASIYSRKESADWCDSHNFKSDVYRTRDAEGVVTHHIHAQFDTSEAVEGSWRVLSDDFPEGISVSICERKNMGHNYTKGVQSENDPFEFIMSDESVDRVGDIIRAGGWDLADFQKNPVALWAHDHGKPIGVWDNVRVTGKKLIGKLKLAKEGTSAEIDTIRSLVEQRIIKAVSVGFQPLEAKPLEKTSGYGYEYTKQRLHECSLVSVPANANALAIAKSFGADPAKVFYGEVRHPKKCASRVTQEKMALLEDAINRSNDFLEKRK